MFNLEEELAWKWHSDRDNDYMDRRGYDKAMAEVRLKDREEIENLRLELARRPQVR